MIEYIDIANEYIIDIITYIKDLPFGIQLGVALVFALIIIIKLTGFSS